MQTDRVLNKRTTQYAYEETEPLRSTHTSEMTRTQARNSGEPGARPNVGASLESSGGATTTETSTEESTEFDKKNLTSHTQVVEAGYQARQISAAISVPRNYFVGLYRIANPDTEGQPADADLQPIVNEELALIKTYVAPLIESENNKGVVEARMAPDPGVMIASMGLGGNETGTLLDQAKQWPIASTALVIMAMGLMLFMFRKAVQQPQLPTVEELAGVPPSLPSDEDIIGEAAETDATMEGIEVDEDELESRKIAEQINDLVKSNPGEAAALFNRWLRTDEY